MAGRLVGGRPRSRARTQCWRRARRNGSRYTVCNKSKGQKGKKKTAKKGRNTRRTRRNRK